MSAPYDRPASEPGGMECYECGKIFVGAEWHDQCAVCANNGWIPVTTPPETSGDYVAWFPAVEGYVAKAISARWNGYHWTDANYRTDDGLEPTHWQPLPKPPVSAS